MILAIIGALFITGLLVYVTLGNLSVFMWSDYSAYDTARWNWKDLWHWWLINIGLGVVWWLVVGTHITFK